MPFQCVIKVAGFSNEEKNKREKYFTPCSSVSIVDFEQVNADWVVQC